MANPQLNRYRNSEYYEKFISENNYNREEFEKKDERVQAEEMKKFFISQKWKLKQSRNTEKNKIEKSFDTTNTLIIKIANSSKCNDTEKIELIKKVNGLNNKKIKLSKKNEEIKKLKKEIEDIEKEIKLVIE